MRTIVNTLAIAAMACGATLAGAEGGGGAAAGGAGAAQAQLQGAPEAVKAAVMKETMEKDAQVVGVDKETRDNRTYYKVQIKSPDETYRSTYTEQGIRVDTDKKTNGWEQAPEAVKTALLKEAQAQGKDAAITRIEKETKNGQVVYKAEIVSQGKGQEIRISQEGLRLPSDQRSSMTTPSSSGGSQSGSNSGSRSQSGSGSGMGSSGSGTDLGSQSGSSASGGLDSEGGSSTGGSSSGQGSQGGSSQGGSSSGGSSSGLDSQSGTSSGSTSGSSSTDDMRSGSSSSSGY